MRVQTRRVGQQVKASKADVINMQWLLSPVQGESDFVLMADVERLSLELADDSSRGWIDKVVFNGGPNPLAIVEDAKPSIGPHWVPKISMALQSGVECLHIGVWTRGFGLLHDGLDRSKRRTTLVQSSEGQGIIVCGQRVDRMTLTAVEQASEYLSVTLPLDALNALLGHEDAHEILAILGVSHKNDCVVRELPIKLVKPLQQALSSPFTGMSQRLHGMARLLEFLTSLVCHCSGQTRQHDNHGRRHKERVRALHDYLSSLDGKLPSLGSLSKEFGMSARRLNEAFAAEYGQSIFAYITDQRLEAAHEVIVASSEPMKHVAERLGYAHVNHFIAAFKRKYGYTPGQLRRGGLGA